MNYYTQIKFNTNIMKMSFKLLGLALILIATTQISLAQSIKIGGEEAGQQDEIQTLFKNKNRKNGFYGGFGMGFSPIDGKAGMVVTGRGSWIINHSFALGLGGTSFVNNLNAIDNWMEEDGEYHLGGGYGGLVFEPIIAPMKPIHVSFPILVGLGGVNSFPSAIDYDWEYVPRYSDFYVVAEPGVELEVNLTSYFRMAAFATYRITSNIDIEDVSRKALNGYSVGLTFKFGIF